MGLQKIYDYFHNYDKQTYQVVACMGNEPSEQDIRDFEDQYNIKLPAEFREFTMSPLGGLYMEVREELWPRAKAFDVGPFWSFCRGIIVYGIADGIPEFLDIRVKTKELRQEGFEGLIPFLSVIGNGDEIFCFDTNNKIVILDYYAATSCASEHMKSEGDTMHFPCQHDTTVKTTSVEGDFSDCLMKQIEELEERKNRKIRGEDKS